MKDLEQNNLWVAYTSLKFFYLQNLGNTLIGIVAAWITAFAVVSGPWFVGIIFLVIFAGYNIRNGLIGYNFIDTVVKGWFSVEPGESEDEMVYMLNNHTRYMYEIKKGYELGSEL